MSGNAGIGLESITSESTPILHARIATRVAFGRITDLASFWLKKEYSLDTKVCGDIRILMQSIMEFAFSKDKDSTGQLELAVENGLFYISIRANNQIVDPMQDIEKALVQYWMNSEDCTLIKKVLYPYDRVEVHYCSSLNLLEWRIVRPLNNDRVNLEDVSFRVFVESSFVGMNHLQYIEMGDLPFHEWMTDVYRNTHEKDKSGDLLMRGESLREEHEWARVVHHREEYQIDEESRFSADNSVKSIDGSQISPNDLWVLKEKIIQYSALLFQKDRKIEKLNLDIINLQHNIEETKNEAHSSESKMAHAFKEKALQMYDMAKELQIENSNLQRAIRELRNDSGSSVSGASTALLNQYEEITKKADRLSRALDAEKQKVKGLLDRALNAEKEAQNTGPLVIELEKKVEAALKMAEQYKKETDKLKQKVFQADAETNRVKNELVKSQAQIQTLTKRNAA